MLLRSLVILSERLEMRIAVIGSGYVGLTAACCLAELGHFVTCVDSDQGRIANLNSGQIPIFEDYLPELVARHLGVRLIFSTCLTDAVQQSEVVFIAVGTPISSRGEADLFFVESVTHAIAQSINGYKLIVEKSTVPVCTSAWIERAMALNGCRRHEFDVASNPEFLREGSAVSDFLYPDRIVVGARSEQARRIMREVYSPLLDGSYIQRSDSVPKPEKSAVPP